MQILCHFGGALRRPGHGSQLPQAAKLACVVAIGDVRPNRQLRLKLRVLRVILAADRCADLVDQCRSSAVCCGSTARKRQHCAKSGREDGMIMATAANCDPLRGQCSSFMSSRHHIPSNMDGHDLPAFVSRSTISAAMSKLAATMTLISTAVKPVIIRVPPGRRRRALGAVLGDQAQQFDNVCGRRIF